MYTLEQLQRKNLAELKEIGWELNVLPEGDRRYRQSWIDAIAGVNPPLLQLLEVSPAVSVEQVQEPIIETVEISPGVEVDRAQEPPIESKFGRIVYPRPDQKPITPAAKTSPGVKLDPVQESISKNEEARPQLDRAESADVYNRRSHPTESDRDSSSAKTETLGSQEGDRVLAVARDCETDRGRVLPDQSIKLVNLTEADRLENEPKMSQSAIAPAVKTFPAAPKFQVGDLVQSKTMLWGIEKKSMTGNVLELLPRGGVRVQFGDHISGYGGTFDFSKSQLEDLIPVQEPLKPIDDFVNTSQRQEPIAQVAKTSPGVARKTSTAHQLLELFKSSAHIIPDSPAETEAKVRQSTIDLVTENSIEEESDQNSILTGLTFSNRFLARYTPPQPEIIHFQSDADGQLSLLNFQIKSVDEPPDPDDFESLDAFREAIARWDAKNPEPPAVSIDSMSEWAPCPEEWYEPKAEILPLKASSMIELPEQSKVMELSITSDCSITSDFFIPTFGGLGDLSNRSDEPPDTGIFARLPKPKPPNFPPQAASQPLVNQASRNPETIPKLFHRVVAGSSPQPARSPPGGDARRGQ